MTCKRTHSDSVMPKACDTLDTSALTSNGNFVLQSSVALPMRAGNPVERENNMPSWEAMAVASLWIRCSAVVAAELRSMADELVQVIVQPSTEADSDGAGSSGQISQ